MLDPSRNMSIYRQRLAECANEPPVVPMLPIVKKDLQFLHDGNNVRPTTRSSADGAELVNFDKLRMIAKEIRSVARLASAPYVSVEWGFGFSSKKNFLLK